MRALVVICVIAGCGDSGLLLDISPGASDATTVEVFLPSDVNGAHMGLPGTQQPTPGTVYTVAEHVTAAVTGGHARILLQPGAMESVPAMLVLAYDGNHAAVAYAVVSDPSGPIQFRHTQSDELKIDLSPITEVSAASASPAPASAPRLVRWTAPPAQPPDDPNGACIAVLREDGTGDFFSPPDDQDCDGAEPECDDHWYLKPVTAATTPPANALCARDDLTQATTMDACRIGDTLATCADNVGDCNPKEPAICAPSTLCDKCNDQIDLQCAQDAFADDKTLRIECTYPVMANTGSNGNVFCQGTPVATYAIDLAPRLGTAFSCSGTAAFYQPPLMPLGMDSLPLQGTHTATVGVACGSTTRGLVFNLTAPDGTPIDLGAPDTRALVVVGVHGAVATRSLVLPFVAHLVPDCQVAPGCRLVEGMDNGQTFVDPLWKCAGGQ